MPAARRRVLPWGTPHEARQSARRCSSGSPLEGHSLVVNVLTVPVYTPHSSRREHHLSEKLKVGPPNRHAISLLRGVRERAESTRSEHCGPPRKGLDSLLSCHTAAASAIPTLQGEGRRSPCVRAALRASCNLVR